MNIPSLIYSFLVPEGPSLTDRIHFFARCIAVGFAMWVLSNLELGEAFLSYPLKIQFSVRNFLGQDPSLDPKIKVIALRSQLAAEQDPNNQQYDYNNQDPISNSPLSSEQWTILLRSILERKPSAVIIDHYFNSSNLPDDSFLSFYKAEYPNMPIIIKGFISEKQVSGLTPIIVPPDKIPSIFSTKIRELETNKNVIKKIFPKATFYAPNINILNKFTYVGHNKDVQTSYESGFIYPIYQLDQGIYIPHMALALSQQFDLRRDRIFINQNVVRLDRKDRLLVNFLDPQKIYQHESDLTKILSDSIKGLTAESVSQNDIVVILPYTDNYEYPSPVGFIPNGRTLVSLINSVVTHKWLHVFPYINLTIIIGVILGMLVGLFYIYCDLAILTWIITLLIIPVTIAFDSIMFSFFDTFFPTVYGMFALLFSALLAPMGLPSKALKRKLILQQNLKYELSPKNLHEISKDQSLVISHAIEKDVTVLFFEFDGISIASERFTSADCLNETRELALLIQKITHKYGGVFKSSFGDSMFSFFGYGYCHEKTDSTKEKTTLLNHAQQAIQCAIEVQQENLNRFNQKSFDNKTMFPLRIGINTAKTHIGLLFEDSFNFSLIGYGLQYARRFRRICEPFRIILGPSTRDLAGSNFCQRLDLKSRRLSARGGLEILEVYECDPFIEKPESLFEAIKTYKDFSGLERREIRWPLPQNYILSVQTDTDDTGKLLDFSLSGFSVQLSKYYAKGTELYFRLDSSSGELKKMLTMNNLLEISGEVCWGRPHGNFFVHGLIIKSSPPERRRLFLSILRQEVVNISDRLQT